METRAFVLVPLRDVAPDWRHPISGASVTALLDVLPPEDRNAVRPV
jgi:2-amino-4-hydroxy-6-hydroxymethyldihydropteridine diphosphokinase